MGLNEPKKKSPKYNNKCHEPNYLELEENNAMKILESANDTIITDNKSLDDICKTIIKNIKIEKV